MNGQFLAIGGQGYGRYQIQWDGKSPDYSYLGPDPQTGTSDVKYFVPGFIDIHVHGAFGIDFMAADSAATSRACRKLEAIGVRGFLPTSVTNSSSATAAFVNSLPQDELILGYHLEGPFISQAYPGAQPQEFILSPEPNWNSDPVWKSLFLSPRCRVTTMAPEIPGGLALMRELSQIGVKIGMGHTNATFSEGAQGFAAGATHTTHTYNAMRGLHHREAGMVGFALTEDRLACELIYDRHHVTREAAHLLIKNKPADRIIGISDGTMGAGMPDGSEVTMWGLDCIVKDGTIRLTDGTLAGSAATIYDVFRNLAEDFGAEVAIRACSLNPARLLGGVGSPERFLVLDSTFQIQEILVSRSE